MTIKLILYYVIDVLGDSKGVGNFLNYISYSTCN